MVVADNILCTTWKEGCYMCTARSISVCTSMRSDLGILSSLTYTTVLSIDSVSGQRRPRLHKGPFRVLRIIFILNIWTPPNHTRTSKCE